MTPLVAGFGAREHNEGIMFSGDREAGRAGPLQAVFAGGMTGRPTPIRRLIGGAGRSDLRHRHFAALTLFMVLT